MLQGQRDLADGVEHDPLRARAARVRAARRLLLDDEPRRTAASRCSSYQAGYGYEERKHLSTTFRSARASSASARKEKKRILLTDVPGDYVRINSGLGESPPLNIIVLPVLFEGSVRAVVELASFSPLQHHAPGVPRPAHREHRPHAEHDRGQHAHREPAAPVAVAGARSSARSRRSCASRTKTSSARRACLADRTVEAEQKNDEVERVQAPRRGEGRPSSRSRRSTSRSSSRTCRTSCARRSTAC